MGGASEEAFPEWYAALWPRALATVTVSCGDADLAEEAVAEAFAKAYARWPAPLELGTPLAWLHTVAINEVRSRWRRRRTERRMLLRLAGQAQRHVDPPAPVDETLLGAVAGLPPRMRQVLALRCIADLTQEETAAALGVTRGTVASTLHDAVRRLRATLEDERSARLTQES